MLSKLKIQIPSLVEELRTIVKESKEMVSENPELTEAQARKIVSENLDKK
jgi:hypothetical protein